MPINKKLGRGIDELLEGYSTYEAKKLEDTGTKVVEIDVSCIRRNENQPRKNFPKESLVELTNSILSHGVLQPLIVREVADNLYQIVAGERRYRAACDAGLKTVPCIVRSFSELEKMEVALIENIQREDLNPVEEAKAYRYLSAEAGLTQEQIGKKVGKATSTITNSINLLNLPEKMLDSLERGLITAGHARALRSVHNPADRDILFDRIIAEDLSVRSAESLAKEYNGGIRAVNVLAFKEKKSAGRQKSTDIQDYEAKFQDVLCCPVEIKNVTYYKKTEKIKKGKIVICFKNDNNTEDSDELGRLYQLLNPDGNLYE